MSQPSALDSGGGAAEADVCHLPAHVRKRRDQRATRLRALGYPSYRAYLRSSAWAATKARYRASDLPQACMCGEEDVHLHHMTYERVGDERLTDLTPLCAHCHTLIHILEFRGEIGLDLENVFDDGRAIEGRALLAQYVEELEEERRERIAAAQREILALPFATRLLRAVDTAKRQSRDMSNQVRLLKVMQGDEAKTRVLRRIEERAYGWDGWRDLP